MADMHGILTVGVIALITAGLRFLPFLIFRSRKTPEFVAYLGKVLPCAIMGMLVIYCLRNISFASLSAFLPELLACALVALIHIWKRNTLLSILSGTLFYMILVQLIF